MDRATPNQTRAAALERRRALSRNGAWAVASDQSRSRRSRSAPPVASRSGAVPAAQAPEGAAGDQSKDASCGCDHGAEAARQVVVAASPGRVVAQKRRTERCQEGRGDAPTCRPTGRMRERDAVPPKVRVGTTLQGTLVTGTHVDPTVKVTGHEAGTCRVITGTEYAGAEQYSQLCDAVPVPGAPKVSVGSTSRGQRVTGTEVGRSPRVTGDEHGSCTAVTGTEYLGADKVRAFCGTAPEPSPARWTVSDTVNGQAVTGTEVGRSPKVTGDEAGACEKLTGTQYVSSSLPESLCGAGAPRKVSVMSTARERTLTGTEVGRSPKVTGDEAGACTSVSGTEYVGLEQYQACNRPSVPAPEKVRVMRTWQGRTVSGSTVEQRENVTGDEYGACQPVSGDEYVGPDQYGQYCAPREFQDSQARMRTRGLGFSRAPSGTPVAADGNVTGSGRGESLVVSGTPYAAGGQGQPLRLRGRLAGPGPAPPPPPATVPSEPAGAFIVSSPAAEVRDRPMTRVTGTAYGGARITGPVDRAGGLVSGTPEFRYREENPSPAASYVPAEPEVPDRGRSRLTGDGRELGFAITGAAWRPSKAVTGTEGASARRNPTLRGTPRDFGSGAMQNKAVERAEVPVSKITGGSGNYSAGSLITYSGGARG